MDVEEKGGDEKYIIQELHKVATIDGLLCDSTSENKDHINSMMTLLSTQQSLVARNRAYFMSICIGLLGLGASIILGTFFYEVGDAFTKVEKAADKFLESGIALNFIAITGFLTLKFWRDTTNYRRYKSWVIETLLIKIELSDDKKGLAYGPMSILTSCNFKKICDAMYKSNCQVGEEVMHCEAKETFGELRKLFSFLFVTYFSFAIFFLSDFYNLKFLVLQFTAFIIAFTISIRTG